MAKLLCAILGHRWFTTPIKGWIVCKRCHADARTAEF